MATGPQNWFPSGATVISDASAQRQNVINYVRRRRAEKASGDVIARELLRMAERHFKPVPDMPTLQGWVDDATQRGPGAVPDPPPPPTLTLTEFTDFIQTVRNDPEPPFMVEDFVPHNGLVIVGGQPKIMKSLAVVQLGVAAAAGLPFLDRQANNRPAFVYLTEEGTRTMHADRIEAFILAMPGALGRCHIVYRQQVTLNAIDALKHEVHALIATHGAAIVAIDPLRDYMPSGRSEKDDDAIATVKAYLRQWLTEEPNLTIILVHHVVKDDKAHSDARALSGSGAIYAMADATVMWYARKQASGRTEDDEDDGDLPLITIVGISGHCVVESRSRPAVRVNWTFDPGSGLVIAGSVEDGSWDDRVMKTLDGHDVNNDGLYMTFRAGGKDKNAIRAALSRLSKKGLIRQMEGGFWTRKLQDEAEGAGRTTTFDGGGRTESAPARTDGLFTQHDDPYHPAPGHSEG